MGSGRNRILNVLTIVTLVATVCLSCFYGLIAVLNPFSLSTLATPIAFVTETPTSGPTKPLTWTPTNTPTITPIPGPTNTRTPTLTPSMTSTWPPTATPTPRVTRSPWPFTCEVQLRRPEYNEWSGVAGHVQDLDETALPGYHVQVQCPGAGTFTSRAGESERYNGMYGSQAAWEQGCDPSGYRVMEIRVQLFNSVPEANGTYRAVSEQMIVKLGGYASGSLGYITCTLNWQDWQ